MRKIVTNNGCPAQFKYEYDENVRQAIAQFNMTKDSADMNDKLLIQCPFERCDRAFELYIVEFGDIRDVRNRVLGGTCLNEASG